jgi:hypothetical protein
MSTTAAAFQLIEIGRLHESPLNPRHTYNPVVQREDARIPRGRVELTVMITAIYTRQSTEPGRRRATRGGNLMARRGDGIQRDGS